MPLLCNLPGCFNPRSREGSDYPQLIKLIFHEQFQSTLPRRERRTTIKLGSSGSKFQSTLPRRERPAIAACSFSIHVFQSTLPRRERPGGQIMRLIDADVSIHAPTKGATTTETAEEPVTTVSIHAPTKGATIGKTPYYTGLAVSIHAPTKGATFAPAVSGQFLQFQSTLPRRERPNPAQ